MSITQRAVLMEAYWNQPAQQQPAQQQQQPARPGFLRRHAKKIAGGAMLGAAAYGAHRAGGIGAVAGRAREIAGGIGSRAREIAGGIGSRAREIAGGIGSRVGTAASGAGPTVGANLDYSESIRLIPLGNLREGSELPDHLKWVELQNRQKAGDPSSFILDKATREIAEQPGGIGHAWNLQDQLKRHKDRIENEPKQQSKQPSKRAKRIVGGSLLGAAAYGAHKYGVVGKAKKMAKGIYNRLAGSGTTESIRLIPLGNLREAEVQELLQPEPTRFQRAKKFARTHKKKLAAALLTAGALAGGAKSRAYAKKIDREVEGEFSPDEQNPIAAVIRANEIKRSGVGLRGKAYKLGKFLGA